MKGVKDLWFIVTVKQILEELDLHAFGTETSYDEQRAVSCCILFKTLYFLIL